MLGGDENINNLGIILTDPKQKQNRLFFMILKKWSAAGVRRSDMIEQLLFFELFLPKSAWISIFREMKNPRRHYFLWYFHKIRVRNIFVMSNRNNPSYRGSMYTLYTMDYFTYFNTEKVPHLYLLKKYEIFWHFSMYEDMRSSM